MKRSVRNFIAAFCATATLGCYSWRPVTLEENRDATTRPEKVRVITKDGGSFDVYHPIVARDTLRGFSDERLARPLAFPVSSIADAQTKRLSNGRTALLVVGAAVGVIAVLYTVLLLSFLDSIE